MSKHLDKQLKITMRNKREREDRKIGSYYDKISADSKKNLFYEIVIQIGDMHDTNCADNPEKEIALLEEYAKKNLKLEIQL